MRKILMQVNGWFFRYHLIKIFFIYIAILIAAGCTTKLIISSDPPDVEVFLKLPNGEKKSLGKTPNQLALEDLEKDVPSALTSGQMYELQLEKPEFETQTLWIPSGKTGLSTVRLYTKLHAGSDDAKLADSLLQYLHNAQKFASNGNFDRAHQEVDMALSKSTKFIRALSMKGALFYNQQKWDESRSWYEKALALDNSFDEAVKMIDQIKKKKGEQP